MSFRSSVRPYALAAVFFGVGLALSIDQCLAKTEENSGCEAEQRLTQVEPEDPTTTEEMTAARTVLTKFVKVLTDTGWTPKTKANGEYELPPLNVDKVHSSLALARRNKIDVDGIGFRALFKLVNRYLLNAKGSEGRLRPMAELLETSDRSVHLLAVFFSQMDSLFMDDEATDAWPAFMRFRNKTGDHMIAQLEAEGAPPHTVEFAKKNLVPLLMQRARMAELHVDASGNRITMLSPVGTYKINLRQGLKERPLIAAPEVHVSTKWGRQNDQTLRAQVDVDLEDPKAQSYLRTMIRADAFLHPHLVAPTLEMYPIPSILSPMQEETVRDMKAEDKVAEKLQIASREMGPTRIAVQATTGAGKTPMVAAFVHDLIFQRWDERWPRIFFVVENQTILEQTAVVFERDLGIPAEKIHLLAGLKGVKTIDSGYRKLKISMGSDVLPGPEIELILATRSSMVNHRDWFEGLLAAENKKAKNLRQPQVLIIDEAHHLEREGGEFDAILNVADRHMTHEDRLIGASATFGSDVSNIVVDRFRGHIVGNNLTREQTAQLKRGQNLAHLSLVQFLNTMADGYVNPIDDQSFDLIEGSMTAEDLRDRLNKNLVADEDLYLEVGSRARRVRSQQGVDRWMLFDVKQTRAEKGAEVLQAKYGKDAVQFMHSGLGAKAGDRLDWLRDAGPHRSTRHQHKTLIVVGQAIEGADAKNVNGVGIMKNVISDRHLQQIIGRGARLGAFKTSLIVGDPAGRLAIYLARGGDLWGQLRIIPERMSPETWRRVTPPLKAEPTAAEIKKHVQNSVAAQDVMTGPDGSAQLFAWNPGSDSAEIMVDLKVRVEQWIARVPSEVVEKHQEAIKKIRWPKEFNPNGSISPLAAMSLRQSLTVLGAMFNDLTPEQRQGLAPVTKAEMSTSVGMSRLFFVLAPHFPVAPSDEYLMRPWTAVEMKTWQSRALRERHFQGKASEIKTLAQFTDFPASRLLRLLPQLLEKKPHLATRKALALIDRGRTEMEQKDRRDGSVQSVATFYIARLINHWQELSPQTLPPWDYSVAFGQPPNPKREQPSMYGFWVAFGLFDSALAKKDVAAEETNVTRGTPGPASLYPKADQ